MSYTEINILGTRYTYREDDLNNSELAEADGICKIYDKEIIVRLPEYLPGDTTEGKALRRNHVILHELVHAFAEESGRAYTHDEDLTDWIASMIPRINNVFAKIMEEYPHEYTSTDKQTADSADK